MAALANHWDDLKRVYGDQGVEATACFHIGQEGNLRGLGGSDKGSVEKAMKAVTEGVKRR